MAVIGSSADPRAPIRSRLEALRRGAFPALAAGGAVVGLVVMMPDRGDVAIYRQGARAAVSTGAVYAFRHQGHGFTYPPFAALAMTALAWFPNWAMWTVLVLVGVASLGVVLTLCAPGARNAVRHCCREAPLGVAALVVSEPVVTNLRFGQIDLLLAAMVMADLLVFRRGALVGLAVALKLTPALFVVFLVVRGRYREAVTAAAVFGATVLWGFAVLPRASTLYWTHNALAGTGIGSFTTVGNQSVRGVVSRVVGAQVGTAVWILVAVPILVLGIDLARRAADAEFEVLALGTLGVTACLVSPVSWPHHWVWLIPLLCGLWRLPAGDPELTRWVAVAAAFAVISQFVPLKAIGIGYVPITVRLLLLQRDRLRSPARHRQPDPAPTSVEVTDVGDRRPF